MTYLRSFSRFVFVCLALSGSAVSSVNASIIIGGDLLDQAGANQLESWLGVGPQVFSNIYDGVTGDTATSWRSAANGIGNTITIFDVTVDNQNFLLGGYRHAVWGGVNGYSSESEAFIFNLTINLMLDQSVDYWGGNPYSIYDVDDFLPVFGGGHDLVGGYNAIGDFPSQVASGYSYGADAISSRGYDLLDGTFRGGPHFDITVQGMETYTLSPASPSAVPVPAAVWLFGTALVGLAGFSKRGKAA